jgi:hypothetical protein
MRPAVRRARLVAGAGAGVVALIGLGYVGTTWARYGRSSPEPRDPLLDRFMPVYEVREVHQTRVAAPAEVTYSAVEALDFQKSPLVKAIFTGREIIMGSTPVARPAQSFLQEVRALGWRVLAEQPGRYLLMGAVTRSWEANVTFRGLSPEEFPLFEAPGYAKIVWIVAVEPVGLSASVIRTETRVSTTDAESRRRFRRYWSFLSPGILLIRREMLRMIRQEAEARVHPRTPAGVW